MVVYIILDLRSNSRAWYNLIVTRSGKQSLNITIPYNSQMERWAPDTSKSLVITQSMQIITTIFNAK